MLLTILFHRVGVKMIKYFRTAGLVLLFLLVYYVVQVAVTGIFGVFYSIRQIVVNRGNVDPSQLGAGVMRYINVILIISVTIALALYMFICWLRNKNLFKVSRFRRTGFVYLVFSTVSGMAISIFFAGLFSQMPIDELFPGYSEMIGSLLGGENFIITVISTGILVPFIEEIIFRGLIYNELKSCLPVSAAAVIQALLFGIYHMNLLQAIYAFLIGLALAYVVIKADSIWPAIVLHAGVNNTSTIMSRLISAETLYRYGILFSVISLIVLSVSLVLIWKKNKSSRDGSLEDRGVVC